ncbi:MAG: hypothetical protein ACRC2R_17920 [Xenococcaceae cyanobacterium]
MIGVEIETVNNILTDYWNLKSSFNNLEDLIMIALNLDLQNKFNDSEEELEAILEALGDIDERIKESTATLESVLEQTTRPPLKLS